MTALIPAHLVEALHDSALNSGELPGRVQDKCRESALARVENHLVYGMVADAFHLAALYAEVISRSHCFNDGNKRTAHQSMNFCLYINGIEIHWSGTEIADRIIALARGESDADTLADWVRAQAM